MKIVRLAALACVLVVPSLAQAQQTGVLIGGGGVVFSKTIPLAAGQLLIGQSAAQDPAATAVSGDCTLSAAGTIVCTKYNGTAFGSAASAALGTSGTAVGLLNTGNTWAGAQTFTPAITPTGGVAASGGFTVSPRNWHTCGVGANAASAAFTDQTPVATEVYYDEIFVPANTTLTGVAVYNGSVASGNVKVGLANVSGANVATSASTAVVGTTVYQRVPFTGTYAAVGPATYYVETFYDNNTTRATAHTVGNCGTGKQTGQTFATGFTAIGAGPTTFTTAVGPVAALY